MKPSRYKKIRKRILAGAGGSILASMLFVGAGTAFADTSDYAPAQEISTTGATGMHIMHRWNSEPKAAALAAQLGMSKAEVKQELQSGKSLKQILIERGIGMDDLGKAFDGQ